MPFQEEFLNLRGTKIQLLKGGSGDPLLYLHSAGGEVVWLPFFERLSQHFTVYLPAHPGFSQSEGLENTLKAREATARVGWNPYLCNPKLRDRLYRITVPTLIIWGESDRLVPSTHGRAYHEGIAGSQLVILEKCGHAPPFEKPEETAKVLVEFFRK